MTTTDMLLTAADRVKEARRPTMNCMDLRVVEFWKRNHEEFLERKTVNGVAADTVVDWARYSEWRRMPDLEIELPDSGWLEEPRP